MYLRPKAKISLVLFGPPHHTCTSVSEKLDLIVALFDVAWVVEHLLDPLQRKALGLGHVVVHKHQTTQRESSIQEERTRLRQELDQVEKRHANQQISRPLQPALLTFISNQSHSH